jgi:hypothetical protein
VLAIAVLHLSHFKRDSSEANLYLTRALHYYGIVLKVATTLMSDINTQIGPALYIFSTICFSFTVGLGPKSGYFLLFSDKGVSEWLVQFRGMEAILETYPELLQHDDLSPIFQMSIRHLGQPRPKSDHLHELRELVVVSSSDDPGLTVLRRQAGYHTDKDNIQSYFEGVLESISNRAIQLCYVEMRNT